MANQDLVLPAGELQGSSALYRVGTSPQTRTAVSQKVRIKTPAYGASIASQIGVVSSVSLTQARTVDTVRGIGYGDQIAELVPGVTDAETADFERALLYLSNLFQAMGYASGVDGPVRSLRHHRWPFDIEQQIVTSTIADADLGAVPGGFEGEGFRAGTGRVESPAGVTPDLHSDPADGAGHTAILTMYEACWLNNWSTSLAADSGMIMESGSVTITDTHDLFSVYGEFLATGNDPTLGQAGSKRYDSIRRA